MSFDNLKLYMAYYLSNSRKVYFLHLQFSSYILLFVVSFSDKDHAHLVTRNAMCLTELSFDQIRCSARQPDGYLSFLDRFSVKSFHDKQLPSMVNASVSLNFRTLYSEGSMGKKIQRVLNSADHHSFFAAFARKGCLLAIRGGGLGSATTKIPECSLSYP